MTGWRTVEVTVVILGLLSLVVVLVLVFVALSAFVS